MPLFDPIRIGAAGASTGYEIEKSLMLNDQRQTYLTFTPNQQGDRRTYTISWWIKFNTAGWEPEDGEDHYFISARRGSNNPQTDINFKGNRLCFEGVTGGSYEYSAATVRRFRDVGSWYHFVVQFDTNQGTAANRIKVYVNGQQETAFTGNNTSLSYPSQGFQTAFGTNEAEMNIGRTFYGASNNNLDAQLAEMHYVDGQIKAPTEFGEYDDNNVWIPKEYGGTYGSSDVGFYLKFTDNSNTTASTMGKDYSGNSNNWTPYSFYTYDISADTPTNNFCTMNINDKGESDQIKTQYGGRRVLINGNGFRAIRGTFGVTSGKWYWEARLETWEHSFIGITNTEEDLGGTTRAAETANTAMIRQNNGNIRTSGNTNVSYGSGQSDGSYLGFALDMDNGKFYISLNGTYFNSGNPANGTNAGKTGLNTTQGRIHPCAAPYDNKSCYYNFGADDTFNGAVSSQGNTDGNGNGVFRYAPPSGFLALCSKNLPDPTIPEGSKYFDVLLYSANNGSHQAKTISGLDFSPDFVWCKNRSRNNRHALFDVVRGATKRMRSDGNESEVTDSDTLTSFNSDGFSIGADVGEYGVNADDGSNFVAWCWEAGSSTVSDSSGSITVNRRTSATAGFSIISYSGNNTSGATIAHGLGTAPGMLVVKSRSQNRGWNTLWNVNGSGAGPTRYVQWQRDHSPVTNSSWWNNTAPSSSVITLGNDNDVNDSSQNYICYAWANVEGYQAVGRYIGNGNILGTFINTGFRPAWVFIRRLDSTGNWILMDEARNPGNPVNERLRAESNNGTSGSYNVAYFFSNGFQLQDQYDGSWNADGGNFAYLAIARHPYKTSNAR
tara:strand:- start:462 stop:2966 length:2505 start_codon:yes stop_codon:yes gene_type:complete